MTKVQHGAAERAASSAAHLNDALAAATKAVDAALDRILARPEGPHARLLDAMRYATFAGGKRLRPFLVMTSSKLFGVERANAERVAAAIEVLHTYSLIHDDLPCMDDDDLRRGRPTTHIAFDEMTAVLAGDALLTLAFEIISNQETHASPDVRCKLIARLAEAAGQHGMIGGQIMDMLASQRALESADVIRLQQLKTGRLFEFACESGAILGCAPGAEHERLRSYARDMGLVFQITDDLLDVTSSAEKTGKRVGKDSEQGKATFVSIFGVAKAREEAAKIAHRAARTVAPYDKIAPELAELPLFLIHRES